MSELNSMSMMSNLNSMPSAVPTAVAVPNLKRITPDNDNSFADLIRDIGIMPPNKRGNYAVKTPSKSPNLSALLTPKAKYNRPPLHVSLKTPKGSFNPSASVSSSAATQIMTQSHTRPPSPSNTPPPQLTVPRMLPPQRNWHKRPVLMAQGTFGCVYKPSMECENGLTTSDSYDDKISKLMSVRDANKEMREYDMIEKADPEREFYLGKPEMCTPKKYDDSVYSECAMLTKRKTDEQNALLILTNGGDNLGMYANNKAAYTDYTGRDFELYWLAMYKFLYGLLMLNKHDLLHFDLKPQNIVYDLHTNDMKLIDFGNMKRLSDYTNPANDAARERIQFWWSFPWEMAFITREKMLEIFQALVVAKSEDALQFYITQQLQAFRKDKQHINFFINIYNLTGGKDVISNNISTIFYGMYAAELTVFFKTIHGLVLPISKFNMDDPTTAKLFDDFYANFIKKSFTTFDLYGTGIAMMYLLTRVTASIESSLTPSVMNDLVAYVYKILTPNALERYTIMDAITNLQHIITKYGWAQKYPKYVADNEKYFGWVSDATMTAAPFTEGGYGRHRRGNRSEGKTMSHKRRTGGYRTIKR